MAIFREDNQMNEEIKEIKIFEEDENGRLTVSKAAAARLKQINEISDEMSENHIDKCSQEGMTFTQVMPKAKGTFDVDNFLLHETEDVVKCFATFEEESYFDEEAFKNENPELYKKYVKTNIIPNVDTKKLQKALKPVFDKYWHEEPSDKPSTLRITVSKKGE